MRQVVDNSLRPIKGLFKKEDGSLIVKNDRELTKNQTATNAFNSLTAEVEILKRQINTILSRLE